MGWICRKDHEGANYVESRPTALNIEIISNKIQETTETVSKMMTGKVGTETSSFATKDISVEGIV